MNLNRADPHHSLKKAFLPLIRHPTYQKAGALLLLSLLCFCLLYYFDNSKNLKANADGQNILERNDYGSGKTTQKLKVKIGELKKEIDVQVSERGYSNEVLNSIFEKAAETLPDLIKNENDTLEEVRSDLHLISEIPDTGIKVNWELDHYDVIDIQGHLIEKNLTEEGTLVKLTAILKYEKEESVEEFYVRVFPPKLNRQDSLFKQLEEQLEEADEETRTESYLPLPSKVGQQKVSWSYTTQTRAFGILLLGIVSAIMICISESQRKKESSKNRIQQMKLDYPQIINKFGLYISAGMTVRKAWFQIVYDYKKNLSFTGERAAYEEMLYIMHKIQTGCPEGDCYEEFGTRCQIPAYRKFGTLLSQNLRKGSKGLTTLLNQESEEAFEERKKLARQLGEEAGTKLIIPLFMMLSVVFIIVTVPAFFSIQI